MKPVLQNPYKTLPSHLALPTPPSIVGTLSYEGVTSLGEAQLCLAVSMPDIGPISYDCMIWPARGSFDELNGEPHFGTLSVQSGTYLHALINLNKGNLDCVVQAVLCAPGYAPTRLSVRVPANP